MQGCDSVGRAERFLVSGSLEHNILNSYREREREPARRERERVSV